ncbi:hypothetical protein MA16_Dca006460 [Dendrobium catenatum]|uniref:Uncharacterized protein n=1 Tax=Dendrobium catenatum TaxID=906689 RepID=A0A2I0X7U1_9ASPA|nr:hypothetical protein MA16_Dca006460 [Dendrobium catenatum]
MKMKRRPKETLQKSKGGLSFRFQEKKKSLLCRLESKRPNGRGFAIVQDDLRSSRPIGTVENIVLRIVLGTREKEKGKKRKILVLEAAERFSFDAVVGKSEDLMIEVTLSDFSEACSFIEMVLEEEVPLAERHQSEHRRTQINSVVVAPPQLDALTGSHRNKWVLRQRQVDSLVGIVQLVEAVQSVKVVGYLDTLVPSMLEAVPKICDTMADIDDLVPPDGLPLRVEVVPVPSPHRISSFMGPYIKVLCLTFFEEQEPDVDDEQGELEVGGSPSFSLGLVTLIPSALWPFDSSNDGLDEGAKASDLDSFSLHRIFRRWILKPEVQVPHPNAYHAGHAFFLFSPPIWERERSYGLAVQRSCMPSGISLRENLDRHFTKASDQASYLRYKIARITVSRTVNSYILFYPILDMFAHTTLTFLLILTIPFNPELLLNFFLAFESSPM